MNEASLVALAADLLESERRLVAVTSAWRRSTDAWARVCAHPAVVAVGGSLVDDVIAALDRVPGSRPVVDAAHDAEVAANALEEAAVIAGTGLYGATGDTWERWLVARAAAIRSAATDAESP